MRYTYLAAGAAGSSGRKSCLLVPTVNVANDFRITGAAGAGELVNFGIGQSFSLVMQFLQLTQFGSIDWLIGKGNASTGGAYPNRYNVTLRSGKVAFGMVQDAIANILTHQTVVSGLNWVTMICIRYGDDNPEAVAPGTCRVYNSLLPGSPVSMTGQNYSVISDANFEIIGSNTFDFNGLVATAAVYNRALTAADIAEVFARLEADQQLSADGCQLYFDFNQAQGRVLADLSSNAIPGNLEGSFTAANSDDPNNSVWIYKDAVLTYNVTTTVRTFTATTELLVRKVRRVNTITTASYDHQRAGVSLAAGSFSFTSNEALLGLTMQEGDTLIVTASGQTSNSALLLFY